MRKTIIVGNWKLNKTASETYEFAKALIPLLLDIQLEIVLCPSAPCLFAARAALRGSNIGLAAQNVFFESHGAFTGEVSADTLLELGVRYAIVGHSERRQYFNETDEAVNKKVVKCLEIGITPIVCVGETFEEREMGLTEETLRRQVKLALNGIHARDVEQIVIAYEPIWAIGTGKTATSREANSSSQVIRTLIVECFGENIASKIRIQYGGSMNEENAAELLSMSDIDGGLIGGASLELEKFKSICQSACRQ